ncbi:MAG: elongation factor G [Planctomycetota bacterium]|jgi:elongation factor G|nr:elongation factor G [Planctomycetota bacterium]MDP6990654.1 elongation factor G [Planctomycetota bacterium]
MTTGALASRNLAFVGHPSSGKTTLVDALAHMTGASGRKGSVADKTSICDTEPEEQEKQHTLQLASVFADHGDRQWTFLDTPGYPDFVAETEGAMFASDMVVAVVSCSSGVTFNLRTKLKRAAGLGRPRTIVVTHLDGDNADFDGLVGQLRDAVGDCVVPVLLPDASGAAFSAVTRTMDVEDSEWRQPLMDTLMDACEDEELMMEYLESQTLTDEQFAELMPPAIAAGALVPLLVCNPDSGLAVENVLQFLNRLTPSGLVAVTDADGSVVEPDPAGGLCATVFNVKTDAHVGKVCLARVWRGTLSASDSVQGAGDEKAEKLGGLFHMVGKQREAIESAGPGAIVAFSKVESIGCGDAVRRSGEDLTVVAGPEPGIPMVALAATPKSRADEQKIGEALQKLSAEDPTFTIHNDSVTHELVMNGMSDLHLQVMEARLKRRYGVEIETSIPRIAFRETIAKAADGHHRHKKQSGGRGQFGECFLRLKPLPAGEGVEFVDAVVGGSIPRNLIPAVEKGIRQACAEGVLTNSVVVDVAAEVYDGKFHAVDSDEASFKMAGSRAFREGFLKAKPTLLEPIMELEIHIPTEMAGTIFSDITSQRRGQVIDQVSEEDGAITVVKAEAPLATVQTYHRDLKSQTSGEGSYSMSFVRYAPVPASEQEKILKAEGKRHEEE